jgi:hypothetical protein
MLLALGAAVTPAVMIADPVFASLFFAIWLGPATSQPGLRAAFLGAAR